MFVHCFPRHNDVAHLVAYSTFCKQLLYALSSQQIHVTILLQYSLCCGHLEQNLKYLSV